MGDEFEKELNDSLYYLDKKVLAAVTGEARSHSYGKDMEYNQKYYGIENAIPKNIELAQEQHLLDQKAMGDLCILDCENYGIDADEAKALWNNVYEADLEYEKAEKQKEVIRDHEALKQQYEENYQAEKEKYQRALEDLSKKEEKEVHAIREHYSDLHEKHQQYSNKASFAAAEAARQAAQETMENINQKVHALKEEEAKALENIEAKYSQEQTAQEKEIKENQANQHEQAVNDYVKSGMSKEAAEQKVQEEEEKQLNEAFERLMKDKENEIKENRNELQNISNTYFEQQHQQA